MKTTLHLTDRDQEILLALSRKVRLFSQRQLAEHWWNGDLANARRRMRRLEGQGLAECSKVLARSTPPLNAPILTWRPGDPDPDFASAAHRCRSRWWRRPARITVVWTATDRAAQLLGGTAGRLKRPVQATHDLGTAAVWLQLHKQAAPWADAWRGEDLMAHTRQGQKLPDAFIVNDDGQVTCVLEFGGGYDVHRVADFHQDCAQRRLPYQLW